MKEKKAWARQEARRLSAFLESKGIALPHKQCLEAVAAMHGSKNWQTFEASSEADIVVNESNALTRVADAVLQSVLFKRLPEGETLSTLCSAIRTANELTEDKTWRSTKAAMNQLYENIEERDWCVPPAQLPERIDAVRPALLEALQQAVLAVPPDPNSVMTELYRSGLRDWRVGSEVDLPPTDKRVYEARFSAGTQMASVTLAYPHTSVETLPEDSPQLGAAFEVNEGLPCVHLYSDIYAGEAMVSVFALKNGALALRINEGLNQDSDVLAHPVAEKLGLDMHSVLLNK